MLAEPHQHVAVEPLDALPENRRRQIVQGLLADPHIRARLTTDRGAPEYIAHPAVRYLAAIVAGQVLGFFALVRRSLETVEIHAALLRQALRHSRVLGRLAIAAAFGDAPVQRVVAPVMEGLESARNYAMRCGMTLDGFEPARTSRGGRPVGAHLLSITRTQWGAA